MVDQVARPTNQSTAQYITAPFELDNLEIFRSKEKRMGFKPLSKAIDARYPLSVSRRDVLWERHRPLKLLPGGNS
jgi:hypothetical protein